VVEKRNHHPGLTTAQHGLHPTGATGAHFKGSGIAEQLSVQPTRLDPPQRVNLTLGRSSQLHRHFPLRLRQTLASRTPSSEAKKGEMPKC